MLQIAFASFFMCTIYRTALPAAGLCNKNLPSQGYLFKYLVLTSVEINISNILQR